MQTKCANLVRACRLPFINASVLPFIFGSLINHRNFNLLYFILGLIAVSATHISANLINDYADALSGADWLDKGRDCRDPKRYDGIRDQDQFVAV